MKKPADPSAVAPAAPKPKVCASCAELRAKVVELEAAVADRDRALRVLNP